MSEKIREEAVAEFGSDNDPCCPECGEETYAPGSRCDQCLEAEIGRDDDDDLCEIHARRNCPERIR